MIRKAIAVIALSGLSLIVGCGGGSSSNETSDTSDTTVAQLTEDEPTWVTNAPGDAFSAPAAQTVCDLMRAWGPPIETSAAQVAELERYTNSLSRLVGSPSDATYSDTYVLILGLALAMLEYEEKYPADKVIGFSALGADSECDSKGMTPENSKFGLKD